MKTNTVVGIVCTKVLRKSRREGERELFPRGECLTAVYLLRSCRRTGDLNVMHSEQYSPTSNLDVWQLAERNLQLLSPAPMVKARYQTLERCDETASLQQLKSNDRWLSILRTYNYYCQSVISILSVGPSKQETL